MVEIGGTVGGDQLSDADFAGNGAADEKTVRRPLGEDILAIEPLNYR